MTTYTYNSRFGEAFKSIDKWKIPETEKKRLKAYIEEYKNGDVTGLATENPERNLERIIDFLKPVLLYLNKETPKLTEADIKKLSAALLSNQILSNKGKPYVASSKRRMFSILKKYLEHHNIHTRVIKPLKKKMIVKGNSKEVLTESEMEDLCKRAAENYQRYTHQVLFWGGLRASEFLGLKESDVQLPEREANFVKIRVRRENTKSDAGERVVTLFGVNCIKAVRDFILERRAEGMTKNDLIMNKPYDALKSWLYRLGEKIGKPLHFHLYRHSAATLISRKIFKGDLIKTCDFFGWEYNSPVPRTYIRRKTLPDSEEEEDETDALMSKTNLEQIEKKLEAVENSKNIEIENLRKQLDKMYKKMAEFGTKLSGQKVELVYS